MMNLKVLCKYFQHGYLWIRKPNSKKMYWPSRDFLGLCLCMLCARVLSARGVVVAWWPPHRIIITRHHYLSPSIQILGRNKLGTVAYLPLNCMESMVQCQHLIFNHSKSRALFFILLLFQKPDWWRRYVKCPKPMILWSRGIIISTQVVTEKWLSKSYLKQVRPGKNFLKETLAAFKWALSEKNQTPVTEKLMIQQSRAALLVSFNEAKLGWKNSLFKPDAVFVIFISMMNCFNSLLFWICNIKQANHYINKGALEICKVGLKKNWM